MPTSTDRTPSGVHTGSNAPDVMGLLGVHLRCTRPAAWAELAPRLGGRSHSEDGVEIVAFAGGKTVQAEPGSHGRLTAIDWYVRDHDALRASNERGARLADELSLRPPRPRVDGVFPSITLADPDGIRVELSTQTPDSTEARSAELGHVVIGVSSLERSLRFYTEVLGLRISDRVLIPLPGGGSTVGVFLRAGDARHHSLALIDTTPGVRHVMIEMPDIDAVGAAFDAFVADGSVTRTLGRHTNDGMFSFYAAGPDAVEIEIGSGGTLVDETAWSVVTHERPSVWGHRFVAARGEEQS